MNGRPDPISWLLDWSPFLDRWCCIRGDSSLGLLLLWSNGVTALVYFLMAIPLIKVYRAHRRNFGAAWFFAGFAAFIALCGAHHALYDLAFRWPAYRLMGGNDAVMAAVSAVVLAAFWASSDDLCRVRPYSEVEAERDEAVRARASEAEARASLEMVVRSKDQMIVDMTNTINQANTRLGALEARYGRELSYFETRKLIAEMATHLGGPESPGTPPGDRKGGDHGR